MTSDRVVATVRPKHPVMNVPLGEGQTQLVVTDNALIYLQD